MNTRREGVEYRVYQPCRFVVTSPRPENNDSESKDGRRSRGGGGLRAAQRARLGKRGREQRERIRFAQPADGSFYEPASNVGGSRAVLRDSA
ncbi:MAG: hypothetical protein GF344_06095 [Chitinivibrionales bacterium]|nr:hypothetical protein [Chitinivibrionales bacterium]MBD3356512.1 hypothetical protein [Chitinivibrionales bacterium]